MTLEARIVDSGYRRYEGHRGGPAMAVRSLAVHSIRRALGLRRPFRAKALPLVVIGIAFIPAIVIIGVGAFLPAQVTRLLPTFGDYYPYIDVAVLTFTALVVPEVLCPDRRTGMLRVYLAAPLDRVTYLLAKAVAVGAVLSVVTLGPLVLLLTALTLEGAGPGGFSDVTTAAARIIASSALLTTFYGIVALAVAGMTDRRAFASVAIVLLFFVPTVVVGVLVDSVAAPQWLYLLDVAGVPIDLVRRLHGLSSTHASLPFAAVVAAAALWTAAAAALLWLRYRTAGSRR